MASTFAFEKDLDSIKTIIHHNYLETFLLLNFSEHIHNRIREIVDQCLNQDADLVLLFLNKIYGSFTIACFVPVFFPKKHRNK